MKFSQERITAALRAKGHSEEKVQRILATASKLEQHGIVTTDRGGYIGLTNSGRRMVGELRAQGKIPAR